MYNKANKVAVSFCTHYCHGRLDVAFVFSVPGAEEKRSGRPLVGETGRNLSNALRELNLHRSDFFRSTDRYDYRITNAYDQPIAKSLGHRKSEASISDVQTPSNVSRVLSELADCQLIVLCGQRAQLLSEEISKMPTQIVLVSHIGNTALNRTYPSAHMSSRFDATERRQQRVKEWASELLAKLPSK